MRDIASSEITPEHIYLNRRKFMVGIGSAAAAVTLAACGTPLGTPTPASEAAQPTAAPAGDLPEGLTSAEPYASTDVDELGDPLNSYEEITNYNNYYEFTTDKEAVASKAAGFPTSPWQMEVDGMVRNPGVYDIEDLRGRFDQEERIYRMRCVEGWSMVIPWLGFPLAQLLKEVEPMADAKYVRFETLYDPEKMPGQSSPWYEWPYIEGLRLDEAMHDLTILSTGLY